MAVNRVIGRQNTIPWRLPADLQHFKRVTMGHSVILGRKTFKSIGKALPGRRFIVLSRSPDFEAEGVKVAETLDAAIERCRDEPEVFVAGGREVYAQAMARADRIVLTIVHEVFQGDVRFPHIDMRDWRCESAEYSPPDHKNRFPHSFCRYERLRS